MAEQPNIIDSEEWRDVPGWEGFKASSLGRVRGPRKLLTPQAGPLGYHRVSMTDRPGKRKKVASVHRIVCAAFLGECPRGMQVNHINNVRHDNRIANLEYVTPKQNCHHRKVHGTFPTGENNGRARLTAAQVAEIRRRRAAGEKLSTMAVEYGVHKNTVWWAATGGTWAE